MSFEQIVLEYSDAQAALTTLRKRASELRTEVLAYMRSHDIDECGMPCGSLLVRKRAMRTEGLKKEHIAGELRKIVSSEAATDEVVNNMYARRATGETETLALVRQAKSPHA